MVEQVGRAEIDIWIEKGKAMVGSLRGEADMLEERARALCQHAARIVKETDMRTGGRKGGCLKCGHHPRSLKHREACQSDEQA